MVHYMRIDVFEKITDLVMQKLENGVVPWQIPWSGERSLPRNGFSKRYYHGINFWLLMNLDYASPYFFTYNQIKYLGGNVKKGEKAFPVVFWKLLDAVDPDTRELKKIPFLNYYNVFNLYQTEGIDMSRYYIPKVENEFSPVEAAEAIVQNWQDKPVIKMGANGACYIPALDILKMPLQSAFFKGEEYYSALFHELIHSTGHEKRLNRFEKSKDAKFGSDAYSQEELVAEMGAAYLCGLSGILDRTIDNSASYIQGWLKRLKDDRKLIVFAAAQAHRAVDYITGVTEDKVVEPEKEFTL